VNEKLQTGPVYRCPVCGTVARRLIPYYEVISPGGHLDAWGDHIAYLDLPTTCKAAGHPARVAVFGSAILPLIFPGDRDREYHTTTEECVERIQKALERIVQEVGPHPATPDPAASIVYRLVAGVLAPEPAIQEIRSLAMAG